MAVFTIRGPAKRKTDLTPRHGGVRWRSAAGAAAMAVAVALTGCTVPAEGPRLVPIAAAPASVDPATATFTCPGVPEASVQAIIGYVLLFPDTSTDPQDGSIRHLECRGKMYTDNARGALVFYSQFGRELHGYHPWQLSRLPHGRRSEAFDVPGVEGATGEFRIPDEEGGPSALITCGDSFVLLAFSNQTPLNGDVKAGIINLAVSMTPLGLQRPAHPRPGRPPRPRPAREHPDPRADRVRPTQSEDAAEVRPTPYRRVPGGAGPNPAQAGPGLRNASSARRSPSHLAPCEPSATQSA